MKRSMLRNLAILLLMACTPLPGKAADQSTPAKPMRVTVTTADGVQTSGAIAEVGDGKLTLATEPAQSFDLADLERIDLGASATPAAAATSGNVVWIGQDNQDLVQIGGAPGGNGIQDIHLRLTNLASKAIKQITVVCRLPKLLRVWRLDTSASPHWRLAIARSDLAADADIYLEPPAGDSIDLKFEITVIYADDTSVKSNVQALSHTSDALKIDRGKPAGQQSSEPAPAAADKAEVLLAGQERLLGTIVSLTPEALVLRTTWDAEESIPLLHIRGVWFGKPAPAGTKTKFEERLADPGNQDVVFVTAPDKSAAEIAGDVQGLNEGKLVLRYEGEDRSLNQERLLGIAFKARAKTPPLEGTHQMFVLDGGQRISGNWVGWNDNTLEIRTRWLAALRLPAESGQQVRIRNGKIVYLPDLEPVEVEEVGYFGRVYSWRADQGFEGALPLLNGKPPVRSLAMHSRCVLTYALNGQFEKFASTVGFDDSGQRRGRVACRILGDGKELFASADLRASEDPVPVEISLEGVQQLRLEVDFGANADIGDRVLWAEPRLFRSGN